MGIKGGLSESSIGRAPGAQRAKTNSRDHEQRLRAASDDTLLTLVRQDRAGAFGELYRRHHREAYRYGRALVSRHVRDGSPDDLVSEAMRKVLSALANGSGPRTGFRPYLFATLRTVAFRESAKARDETAGPPPERQLPSDTDTLVETDVAAAALSTLPEQSQRILWLTELLQLPAAESAALLGVGPASVRVAAMRAREALRVAYARQFLPSSDEDGCRRARDHLARRAVATISPRQARSLDSHLAWCTGCQRASELLDAEVDQWPRGLRQFRPSQKSHSDQVGALPG